MFGDLFTQDVLFAAIGQIVGSLISFVLIWKAIKYFRREMSDIRPNSGFMPSWKSNWKGTCPHTGKTLWKSRDGELWESKRKRDVWNRRAYGGFR